MKRRSKNSNSVCKRLKVMVESEEEEEEGLDGTIVNSIKIHRAREEILELVQRNLVRHTKCKIKSPDSNNKALCNEKQKVLKMIEEGSNILITGVAGTGKTFMLKAIIKKLSERFYRKSDIHSFLVTSTTGKSAVLLPRGVTINSALGWRVGQTLHQRIQFVKRSPKFYTRLRKLKVLIVDEVSMMSRDMFQELNVFLQEIIDGGKGKCWGGVQVIFSGDFLQLPPVGKKNEPVPFCFESLLWTKLIDHVVDLRNVYRCKDPEFLDVLQRVRLGAVDEKTNERLFECNLRADDNSLLDYTKLPAHYLGKFTIIAPLRHIVQHINLKAKNNSRNSSSNYYPHIFTAQDRPILRGNARDVVKMAMSSLRVKEVISLNVGMRVMLTRNIPDKKLSNGSTGVIVGFAKGKNGEHPLVAFDTHASSDKCSIDSVAHHEQKDAPIPIERFRHEVNVIINGMPVSAHRTQVPLIPATACTIHKSQGSTLTDVVVVAQGIFEEGQAYVAFSRCKKLEDLNIIGYSSKTIKANTKALLFYYAVLMNTTYNLMYKMYTEGDITWFRKMHEVFSLT